MHQLLEFRPHIYTPIKINISHKFQPPTSNIRPQNLKKWYLPYISDHAHHLVALLHHVFWSCYPINLILCINNASTMLHYYPNFQQCVSNMGPLKNPKERIFSLCKAVWQSNKNIYLDPNLKVVESFTWILTPYIWWQRWILPIIFSPLPQI